MKFAGSLRTDAPRLVCLGLALAFIVVLFGDVLFLNTSLAPLDYDQAIFASETPLPKGRSIIPEREGRSVIDGQADLWSASAQFQPAVRFMAFCLRSGESPYWDPYIATGNLGPETLVDLKFAPVTLAAALFGGGSAAIAFVLVGIYLIAAYCVLRTITEHLRLSLSAGIAGCGMFFLNGFALANLGTAIGQPYFLAPMVMYSMLLFTERLTPGTAAAAILAQVALLSTTFMPTAVLALVVVYSITTGLAIARKQPWVRILATHAAIPIAAVLLLALLYLPVLDAFGTYLSTVSQYNARQTPGMSAVNVLSLFTPKHFWESYAGMRLPPTAPQGAPLSRYTFHLGIIGPLIAAHAVSRLSRETAPIVIAATFCLLASVGQIFGVFPFTVIDSLPFFSFVQNDYWPCMAALSLVVLVAYGYDAISNRNALNSVSAIIILIVVSGFFFLYGYLGLYGRFATTVDVWTKRYVILFWIVLLGGTSLLALTRWSRASAWTKKLLLVCLVAEGLYYMNGLRPERTARDERLPESIAWLKSEVDRHPGARILNIGRHGVFPNWGSGLQIPQLGLISFCISWYESFYHQYIGKDIFLTLGVSPGTAAYLFTDASLSVAGVRYVVVDRWNTQAIERLTSFGYPIVRQDSLRLIFENSHAMARSFAVRALQTSDGLVSDTAGSIAAAATTTDASLLSEARRLGVRIDDSHQAATASDVPDSVNLVSYNHDRILVRCNLKQPAIVVLTDSWNPRWMVAVDGAPAVMGKVNVAFRGVAVPAGQHEVAFRYQPLSRIAGQVISLVSLFGIAGGLWFWNRKRQVPAHDLPAPPPVLQTRATKRRRSGSSSHA